MPKHTDGNDIVSAPDSQAWRSWLKTNHKLKRGAWLVFYKSGSDKKYVHYAEAVEQALCFGWIDSKKIRRDEHSSLQFFSPRNPKSNWSKLNKERVARLIATKKMTKAGLAMVELAKKTGTWDALNEVEQTVIPDDLAKALTQTPAAFANFNAFPKSSRMIILGWILSARTSETRTRRINETVSLAAENIRANHYKPPAR